MIVSPDNFIKEHEKDSYQQLIKERNRLVMQIKKLEKILFHGYVDSFCMLQPGPDVLYQTALEYLGKLCAYMSKRYNQEYENPEDEDEIDEDGEL